MDISVHVDRETSERAGASGTFQVISVEDESGNDLTNHIDQGVHFSDLDEVKSELEKSMGKTIDSISEV